MRRHDSNIVLENLAICWNTLLKLIVPFLKGDNLLTIAEKASGCYDG